MFCIDYFDDDELNIVRAAYAFAAKVRKFHSVVAVCLEEGDDPKIITFVARCSWKVTPVVLNDVKGRIHLEERRIRTLYRLGSLCSFDIRDSDVPEGLRIIYQKK